jgi:hypothetical protein
VGGEVSLSNQAVFLAQRSSDAPSTVHINGKGVCDDTKLPTSASIDSPSCVAISRATQQTNGEKNGEAKCPKQVYLTSKVLRQILVAKETLF